MEMRNIFYTDFVTIKTTVTFTVFITQVSRFNTEITKAIFFRPEYLLHPKQSVLDH
jgi:hypothetical protein